MALPINIVDALKEDINFYQSMKEEDKTIKEFDILIKETNEDIELINNIHNVTDFDSKKDIIYRVLHKMTIFVDRIRNWYIHSDDVMDDIIAYAMG